jgi:CMP-N,N'-diacetyllegionaminic acid synthase
MGAVKDRQGEPVALNPLRKKDYMAKVLCLINARGGSKGLPGKNIKPLAGKPLIAWSIDVAKQSKLITKVVVSTDSDEIAHVASQHGAHVPFKRPADLASDDSKQIDTVIHAIKFLESMGERYDYVCILQPTAPLRSLEDVDGTLDLLIKSGADSAVTVLEDPDAHPAMLYKMGVQNKVTPYIETQNRGTLRQQLEPYYRRVGLVYAMKRDVVMNGSLYGKDTRGYKIARERAFNIDTEFDFDLIKAWVQYQKR